MEKRKLKKHNGSHETILKAVESIIGLVTRDIDEFESYKYSRAKLEAIKTLVEKFKSMKSDSEFLNEISSLSDSRTELKLKILSKVAFFKRMIEDTDVYQGKNIRIFSTSALSYGTESKFITQAGRVESFINSERNLFNSRGLTESDLNEFRSDIIKYVELNERALKIKDDRTKLAKKRNHLLDEIYTEIAFICTLGKGIWEDVDEKKREDYLITAHLETRNKYNYSNK